MKFFWCVVRGPLIHAPRNHALRITGRKLSMGDMMYLAAGYAVFWIVSFVFVYSLVSRQRSLQKSVEVLEQLVQHNADPD
jgi:hypothetical protein